MVYLGSRVAGTVVYIPFHTFNAAGASVTLTGLAVTDIEIYKNGSVTQRASDSGYTLFDTDGVDFDGITGLHGFSVNLADNTDSGFFSAGNFYMVAVSAVTVDGQTVNFWAGCFDLISPEVTVSEIADGVWDEAKSGHTTAGSTGKALIDTETAVGTTVPTAIAALNNLSTTQVRTEVVGALASDTYPEPGQEAPAVTTSLSTKIGYLYKAFRNKKTQDATTYKLFADDGTTVAHKASVSDDGTTATKGELVSGP